jgi:hypothetical protein
MTNLEILEFINELEREYKSDKEGFGMVYAFIREFKTLSRANQLEVLNFLLDELKFNKNELYNFSRIVINKLQDRELGDSIYKIYNEFVNERDKEWQSEILYTLLILKYDKCNLVFEEYISYLLKIRNGQEYYYSVLYCRINKIKGIEFLAQDFIQSLISLRNKPKFHYSTLGYLFHYFTEIKDELLSIKLLEKIKLTNDNECYELKK